MHDVEPEHAAEDGAGHHAHVSPPPRPRRRHRSKITTNLTPRRRLQPPPGVGGCERKGSGDREPRRAADASGREEDRDGPSRQLHWRLERPAIRFGTKSIIDLESSPVTDYLASPSRTRWIRFFIYCPPLFQQIKNNHI